MNTQRHWTQSSLWKRAAASGLLGMSIIGSASLLRADDAFGGGSNEAPNSFQPWQNGADNVSPAAMKAWQPQNPPKAEKPVGDPGTPPAPAGGEGPKTDEGKVEGKAEEAKPEEDKGFQLGNFIFGDSAKEAADAGWKIGGSTVQSFTWNFQSPKDRFNGPVTWTDRSNEYQLNQQWLFIERATDTSKCDWDLGMRVDLNYGTNYRWMTSAGLEDRWGINTSHSFYGLALVQAYVETAYKKLKVKWGHFGSPVGYFTLDTTQNFFNTLPYTYQYGEPFTHWGALATYTPDDHWAVGGGVIRGWDNFDGSGTGSKNAGGIGTLTYTWEDKSSLAWVGLLTNEVADLQNLNRYSTRYFQTLVYQKPLNECVNYVFQTDFGVQGDTNAPDGRRIGTAMWYGVNQYMIYKQNDQLSWGANFEWFRDDGGFRVGGVLPTATTPNSDVRGLPLDRFGYDGSFFQVTMGPKWQPHPNIFVRPNLRFDWYTGDANNPGGKRPYDNGNSNHQGILGTDIGIVY